jgi:flavodoxin
MPLQKDALILFWSKTGNTKKVADIIMETVSSYGLTADLMKISPDLQINFFNYSLIFCGAPVYGLLPPDAVSAFLKKSLPATNPTVESAPEMPGHAAVMFCTYGGGHTGVREAMPCLMFMQQIFEHAGIRVVEEWPVAGDFKQSTEEYNTRGRLGDIRGRPNDNDCADIAGRTTGVLRRLQYVLNLKTAGT